MNRAGGVHWYERMTKKETSRQRVLITGITGGIGRAVAALCAARGFHIIGQFNNAGAREVGDLTADLKAFGVPVELLQADFANKVSTTLFLKKLDRYPALNLVNNAGGVMANKDFLTLNSDDLDSVMRVNFYAPLFITQKLFPGMQKAGYGRIVNISSVAAKYGGASSSLPYGAAKRALEGMTRTLARAGASANVFVNNVRPGVIDTPFHQRYPKDMKARIGLIPVKRMGAPEDAARAVLFLIDGNDYITGQTITVAGGE